MLSRVFLHSFGDHVCTINTYRKRKKPKIILYYRILYGNLFIVIVIIIIMQMSFSGSDTEFLNEQLVLNLRLYGSMREKQRGNKVTL